MAYTCIEVETREHVGLIRLDRPKALNALNKQLLDELSEALQKFDADEDRCDGSDRQREGLRRWRRHHRNGTAELC